METDKYEKNPSNQLIKKMDIISIINLVNNIVEPHFYFVKNPENDQPCTNFNPDEFVENDQLFWKLNGKNKNLISANKQNELFEMVKQLNLGNTDIWKINGIGKFLVLELSLKNKEILTKYDQYEKFKNENLQKINEVYEYLEEKVSKEFIAYDLYYKSILQRGQF